MTTYYTHLRTSDSKHGGPVCGANAIDAARPSDACLQGDSHLGDGSRLAHEGKLVTCPKCDRIERARRNHERTLATLPNKPASMARVLGNAADRAAEARLAERREIRAFVGKPDADGVYTMICEGNAYTARRVDRATMEAHAGAGVSFTGSSYGYVVDGPWVGRGHERVSTDLEGVRRLVQRAATAPQRAERAATLEQERREADAKVRAQQQKDERERELREQIAAATLAWLNCGIYRAGTREEGTLLDLAYALHEHTTGETPEQARERWETPATMVAR